MTHIQYIINMPARKIRDLINFIRADYKKYSKSFTAEELVKILRKLSDTYYNTEETLVPDAIYDDLKELLEQKDPENPYLEEIGAPIKGTKNKVKLPNQMGSLSKIKPGTGDLEKWTKKFGGPYVISDKLDGVSAQLCKNSSGKTFLYTRGDGVDGQDISHLIDYFVKKTTLDLLPNSTCVRGELVISKLNFEKIKSYMKNARNAVAGLANSKTVDAKIAKLTDFVTYSVLSPKYKISKQLELLSKMGFKVVEYKNIKKMSDEIMKEYLLERKKKSTYEMDGIVCFDDSAVYEQTGGYPDHAVAFKMLLDDQIVIATVVDVEWNVSKNGYLKPRVKITPVNLLGTTVTYATGHNAKFIIDGKLGPGAQIKIVRSGDVIPYILEIVKPAKTTSLPPFKYKWNETEVDLIVDQNDPKAMKMMNLKQLIYFFSTMDIKYLGEGMLAKFVEAGLDTVPKILKAKKKDFADMDGAGDKSITKIYDEINKAFKEVELHVFMAASHQFGRGLGRRKLEEVTDMYPNIIMDKCSKDDMIEKILKVPGFALKSAELFTKNFASFKKFYNEIAKIVDLSRFEDIEETDSESDDESNSSDEGSESSEERLFENQTVVLTQIRDKEIEKFIKKNGGKVTTSVSKNTTIVVHADGADPSKNKLKKASELGIKLIPYSEFKAKYAV